MLFELIAHRSERHRLLLTANQPLRQWKSRFTDSMLAVAAIERLSHQATMIELQAERFRKQAAISRIQAASSRTRHLISLLLDALPSGQKSLVLAGFQRFSLLLLTGFLCTMPL